MVLDITDFTCADVGPNTVTLTVTDNNGNSDQCTATVTVIDTISPVATCQAINAYLDATGNVTIAAADVNDGSTDACGIASLVLDITDFTCADVGANTVTLTVTDNNGNSDQCTATVTVIDTISPVATCQAINAYLDATGNVTIAAADVNNGSTDACGIASMVLDITDFACADVGGNTVTLTVTDNNGNTDQCTATVTVIDTISPVATCQAINAYLDATGNVTIAAADVNDGSTDACGIASLALDVTDFTCANIGGNTVTLTVTDNNGNSDQCTATVTVIDTISPVAVCQDITVQLDTTTGIVIILPGDIDNGSNDACGIANLELDRDTFRCEDLGYNPVTLTVTDNNGNITECDAVVLVEFEIAPDAYPVPELDTICDNGTTNIELKSNLQATTFTWIAIPHPDISGASDDATGTLYNINQALQNNSDTARSVLYIITQHTYGCAFSPDTAMVWIEPTPIITAEDDTICDGDQTDIDISSVQVPTRAVYYTYTSTPDNAGAVTGNTSELAGQPITVNIQDNLDNTTDQAQRVVYTITPHVLRSDNSIGCPGAPITSRHMGGANTYNFGRR